jgi:crotonobetainyl-CoA:carnitine CoA-transferase CaiB-like acyl-CoA transferase
MKMRRVPPKLGEHTDEILREAGIERSQVEELRAAKVIV